MDAYALNPTIGGALIGSGAALIAVFLTTFGTFMTLRANRIAARDERLWERRTELYESLLRFSRDVMRWDLSPLGGPPAPPVDFGERLSALEVKAQAYGSDEIWRRYLSLSGDLLENGPRPEPGASDKVFLSACLLNEAIRAEMLGRKARSGPTLGRRLRHGYRVLTGREKMLRSRPWLERWGARRKH